MDVSFRWPMSEDDSNLGRRCRTISVMLVKGRWPDGISFVYANVAQCIVVRLPELFIAFWITVLIRNAIAGLKGS